MKLARTLSLIALIAYLPPATGCSTVRTVPVTDDPVAEGDPLSAGEPVAITAYTDARGSRHDWTGLVRAAGADSLEFTRPGSAEGDALASGESERPTLRLARSEVTGLVVQRPHARWIRLVAVVVALGLITIVAIDAFQNAPTDIDLSKS